MNFFKVNIFLVVLVVVILGVGVKDVEFFVNQCDFFKFIDQYFNDLIKLENEYVSDKNIMVIVEFFVKDVFICNILWVIQVLIEFGW